MMRGLNSVLLMPGEEEGTVEIMAGSPTKVFKATAEGHCERQMAVPSRLLTTLGARHRDADQIAIVKDPDDVLISIRSFSPDCSVQISGPEATECMVQVPDFKPGPQEFEPMYFDPRIVQQVLSALGECKQLAMQPFCLGLIVKAQAERWQGQAFVAGITV